MRSATISLDDLPWLEFVKPLMLHLLLKGPRRQKPAYLAGRVRALSGQLIDPERLSQVSNYVRVTIAYWPQGSSVPDLQATCSGLIT